VKLGHVAIDGTKMQGNASKHKAMSYERMKETEARLEGEVRDLLERASAQDADEDQRFGDRAGEDNLPDELDRRSNRLEKIRSAKAGLEAEAKKAAAAHKRELAEKCRDRASLAETSQQQRLNETAFTGTYRGGATGVVDPAGCARGLDLDRPVAWGLAVTADGQLVLMTLFDVIDEPRFFFGRQVGGFSAIATVAPAQQESLTASLSPSVEGRPASLSVTRQLRREELGCSFEIALALQRDELP
jgi:hypothetical protein